MQYTLRQLAYVAAAAEAGSVAGAARRCHVSQPSVSAAIAHLEQAFGVALFVRHHARGISPTPAGRRLTAEARALLAHAEEFAHNAAGLAQGLAGALDVGCFITFAPLVLPGLLRALAAEHPAIRVAPHEEDLRALRHGLRHGRFELALAYDLDRGDDIAFEALATVPIHAMLPASHRLARQGEIRLAELAGEPFVLLALPGSRGHFLSVFAEAGIEPTIACETHSIEMARGLVANGYGYSLLHSRAAHDRALDGRRLATVPLAWPRRDMRLGLARLAAQRPTRMGEAFASICRRHLAGLVEAGRAPRP